MRPVKSIQLGFCLICLLAVLSMIGCAFHSKALDYTMPHAGTISPLSAYTLWDSPNSTPERYWRENRLEDPEKAERFKHLMDIPTAIWIKEGTRQEIEQVMQSVKLAKEENRLPVFCIYNIVARDIDAYSAGGAKDANAYRTFIRRLDIAFATSPVVIILEPDSLAQLSALSEAKQKERLELLKDAVQILGKNPKCFIYLDGGNSDWHTPKEQVKRLKQAGVDNVRGFALNVSNFQSMRDNIKYATAISKLTHGKSAIIDTSRCGLGPAPDQRWCNPPGRALGPRPTTNVHAPLDALLWVKHPWESDGNLDGAPIAGEFYSDYAFELMQNAGL
jgi:endoglucanase